MCYQLINVCVLCYVCVVAFILIDIGEANDGKLVKQYRHKRYLSFRNMSHFFLRFNFKANMVPWNQIFAQAVGFRMNWDNPPDTFHHPYRSHFIHRRTVYSHMETLLDKNGLNGFECVRRAICELEALPEPREIYHKLLKMVFRLETWNICDELESFNPTALSQNVTNVTPGIGINIVTSHIPKPI